MCVGASVFAQISVGKLQLSVLSGPQEQTWGFGRGQD